MMSKSRWFFYNYCQFLLYAYRVVTQLPTLNAIALVVTQSILPQPWPTWASISSLSEDCPFTTSLLPSPSESSHVKNRNSLSWQIPFSRLDMCRRTNRFGECNRGTAGFAYVGGACVVNKRLEKVNSVAIVEDTGGFSGIIVAAHELGHLLGAVHDGSPPPSYLGGPGARKCRWEDGFIMSDLRHTSKGFRWSHCTIKQFHHFLK